MCLAISVKDMYSSVSIDMFVPLTVSLFIYSLRLTSSKGYLACMSSGYFVVVSSCLSSAYSLVFFSLRLLSTTLTLLAAIAAAPSIGCSSPMNAMGIAIALYAHAQNRFCFLKIYLY